MGASGPLRGALAKRRVSTRHSPAARLALLAVLATLIAVAAPRSANGCGRTFLSANLRPRLGTPEAPVREAVRSEAPGASEAASAANLAKSIIGAGVLAVPSSAAQVAHQAQSVGLDSSAASGGIMLLFLLFGALNAFCFYLLGEVCERTGARSYQQAWVQTMGKDLAWLPSVASLICCLTGTVSCASVIGDASTELLTSLTGTALGPMGHDALLWAIAGTVIMPLCMLPSLSPLAFASLLGLVGVSVLAVVMVVRTLDGSYLPGGEFNQAPGVEAAAQLVAGTPEEAEASVAGLLGRGLLFVAVLSNAFSAHFNAPSLYEELRPSGTGRGREKLSSFRDVTLGAFGFAGVLFAVVTLAGMQTFGTAALPSILSNYASADPLAMLARAGLCLCVLFEFPLLERCVRTAAVELLGLPAETAKQPQVVVFSVASAIALACTPGLGLDKVSAFGGALGASLLIYVAPALMALKLREQDAGPGSVADAPASFREGVRPVEFFVLRAIAGFGAMVGGLGVAEAAGMGGF